MEELKLLIGMVKDLPAMALWVLAGFWAYKVIVIGSIYGVIKFVVSKFIEWRTYTPPAAPVVPKEFTIGKTTINEEVAMALMGQIQRLNRAGYIHMSDVAKLSKALDSIKE
jgi:hypothetical protein